MLIRPYMEGDTLDPKEPLDGVDGWIRKHASKCDAYTLFGDKCYAIGGIMPIANGVGTVWMFVSRDVPALTFVRTVKAFCDIAKGKYHHLNAFVREDFTEGRRLAEHFGFTQECIMRKMSPDKTNMVLYVWAE